MTPDRRGRERTVFLSEIVGSRVVDSEGRSIGKVTDLEVAPRRGYEIVGLVVGPSTFVSRITAGESIEHPVTRSLESRERFVDWSAVERFSEKEIVVKADQVRAKDPGQ
jgi:sporulation protein YlmC with PRC-barrel domain